MEVKQESDSAKEDRWVSMTKKWDCVDVCACSLLMNVSECLKSTVLQHLLVWRDMQKFSISLLLKCLFQVEFKEYLKFTNSNIDLF